MPASAAFDSVFDEHRRETVMRRARDSMTTPEVVGISGSPNRRTAAMSACWKTPAPCRERCGAGCPTTREQPPTPARDYAAPSERVSGRGPTLTCLRSGSVAPRTSHGQTVAGVPFEVCGEFVVVDPHGTGSRLHLAHIFRR